MNKDYNEAHHKKWLATNLRKVHEKTTWLVNLHNAFGSEAETLDDLRDDFNKSMDKIIKAFEPRPDAIHTRYAVTKSHATGELCIIAKQAFYESDDAYVERYYNSAKKEKIEEQILKLKSELESLG